ncbi:MAG: type II secretion system F family protein, partial [Candidatus Kerfeldbacteria bacterium]|nr:type II secretion system F family protein [Candidatus Kerfeldbacteria bacterium]
MAIFDYRAKNRQGETVKGAVEAPSEMVAADVLKEQNLIILAVSERKRRTLFQSSLSFLNRIPRKQVVIFARQLAVMISATVPIVQALRILVKQTEHIGFKIIISEIADEVDGGAKLSAALARYPDVFSDFFVHMIRSGETTGKLDETLNYLADQQAKDYDLISKIRGAMIYPIFIVTGLVAVGILMMTFVIPKLTKTLEEGGAELPVTTRVLIAISNFLTNQWWLLVLIVVGVVAVYRSVRRTQPGKAAIDRFKLRVPIFGGIFQRIYLVRF